VKTSEQTKPELGRREQNKMETRRRIRAAARELFCKYGYDRATLRQIAKRAHVGLGTLFNYAQDKRDLVFLIFNDQLEAVATEGSQAVQSTQPVVEQLMSIFGPHYEFFAVNPTVSRILLKDMAFYSEGKQAADFHKIRARLIAGIEEIVLNAQRLGEIRSDEDPVFIARHIFLMFAAALRWWIASSSPDPRDGLADLRETFRLLLDGLQSTRGSLLKASSRARRETATDPKNENLSPQGTETLLLSRRANSKGRL
jgi:TetR/AcrR family transcriptional regulator